MEFGGGGSSLYGRISKSAIPDVRRVCRTKHRYNDAIAERKVGARLHEGIAGSYSVLVSPGCHNKYHRLAALNNRSLFPPSSGGQKSKIRVPAWSSSGESSLPGSQMAAFLLSPHVAKRETERGL